MSATPQDRALECVFLVHGTVVMGPGDVECSTDLVDRAAVERAAVDSETP